MSTDPAQLATRVDALTGALRVPRRADAVRALIPGLVHALLPVAIALLWAVAIRGVDLRDMTDLGLVSVMPLSTFVLLFALTASFCVALRDRPGRPWLMFVHVLVLVVMLYGVTAFLESEPRFSSVYRHSGIIDHIIRHGSLNPGIDAYFNWPGFFALGGIITQAAGVDPLSLTPWAPLVFNLLFLAPLCVIFRWASDDPRVMWLALWVFYSANWVGQDTLAPQAVAYMMWLAMLGALLTWFAPRPKPLSDGSSLRTLLLSLRGLFALVDVRRVGRRLRDEAEHATGGGSVATRAGLIVTIIVMFAAVVTGHQLTPFPALLAVTLLVLLAGLETRRLPVLMAIIVGAWISYQTTTFLTGHLGWISTPLASPGQNLTQNVSARVTGSSDHTLIVQIRMFSSVLIWLLAIAGAVRRLASGRADVALMVVGATPFVLPIIQPYGGEMFLRVFLFVLPVAAFFTASLAFPTASAGRNWRTLTATGVVCCALLVLFQFTRHGNERLDYFAPGDAATVSKLYESAPEGAVVVGATNLPWRDRHYVDYAYTSIFTLQSWGVPAPDPDAIAAEMERIASKANANIYVVITRSVRAEAEMLHGKHGVLERVMGILRSRPGTVELYRNRDGNLFRIRPAEPVATPAAQRSAVASRRSRSSRNRNSQRPRRSLRRQTTASRPRQRPVARRPPLVVAPQRTTPPPPVAPRVAPPPAPAPAPRPMPAPRPAPARRPAPAPPPPALSFDDSG
ncbi:MAG: hypothetical protein M3N47_07860 [Chloroflexota bacterium]|nr:hypothetical protein [Chloroflexota bacterium]